MGEGTVTRSTTLVLGGGMGGLAAATGLRRLGKEHRVVLFDREERHTFPPSLPWLMTGIRAPEEVQRPLSALQAQGIEFVQGTVEAIDPVRRRVSVNGRQWQGDYLVVSLGAHLAPERVPGLAEGGCNIYCFQGAAALREARRGFRSGRLVVLVAGVPFKCPVAPYEIAMLLAYDCGKRGVRENVEVSVYTPEDAPLGVAGPGVSAGVCQLLQQRRPRFYPHHQVTEVDPRGREVHFDNGARASYDLLVYVAPHVAPPVVQEAGLANGEGWIPVDRHTLETRYPGVYAIGDVTTIPLSVGLPLPKTGVFAERQAEVVAHNIACAVTGTGTPRAFDGRGGCFIEVGGGRAAFGRGNFYAEPWPTVKLYRPSFHWHAAKVHLEKEWFRRWY